MARSFVKYTSTPSSTAGYTTLRTVPASTTFIGTLRMAPVDRTAIYTYSAQVSGKNQIAPDTALSVMAEITIFATAGETIDVKPGTASKIDFTLTGEEIS